MRSVLDELIAHIARREWRYSLRMTEQCLGLSRVCRVSYVVSLAETTATVTASGPTPEHALRAAIQVMEQTPPSDGAVRPVLACRREQDRTCWLS